MSKLFSNLTVQTVLLSPSEVQLHIKGVELPSIVVTPEVSTSTSLTKPGKFLLLSLSYFLIHSLACNIEISGAVSFLDRNFLGMGENVQFIVSKRETTNSQVNELPPSIRFNWSTNKFGRKNSINIGYEVCQLFTHSLTLTYSLTLLLTLLPPSYHPLTHSFVAGRPQY